MGSICSTSIASEQTTAVLKLLNRSESLSHLPASLFNLQLTNVLQTQTGWTLLHLLVWQQDIETLRQACEQAGELLDQADSKMYAEQGNTPLHLACLLNYVEAAKVLIVFGADTDATNLVTRTKQGKQPLDLATTASSDEIRVAIQDCKREISKNLNMSTTALLGRSLNNPGKTRDRKVQPQLKGGKYKV